jgi:ATP-binding cassette subfamily C (CFTR/MRP) protein 1
MGWEVSFQKLITTIRSKEISTLIKAQLIGSFCSFIWSCAPFIVVMVSFTVFILLDDTNNLDPNKAFVSLALFNIIRNPLNLIPLIVQGLVQV